MMRWDGGTLARTRNPIAVSDGFLRSWSHTRADAPRPIFPGSAPGFLEFFFFVTTSHPVRPVAHARPGGLSGTVGWSMVRWRPCCRLVPSARSPWGRATHRKVRGQRGISRIMAAVRSQVASHVASSPFVSTLIKGSGSVTKGH
jgi:hypothetical protein